MADPVARGRYRDRGIHEGDQSAFRSPAAGGAQLESRGCRKIFAVDTARIVGRKLGNIRGRALPRLNGISLITNKTHRRWKRPVAHWYSIAYEQIEMYLE